MYIHIYIYLYIYLYISIYIFKLNISKPGTDSINQIKTTETDKMNRVGWSKFRYIFYIKYIQIWDRFNEADKKQPRRTK